MKRFFVFLNENKEQNVLIKSNIDILVNSKSIDQIFIASNNENIKQNISQDNCQFLAFPNECNTTPKKRNWINKYFKEQNFDGFLYVAEDTLQFANDIDKLICFLNKLEHAMIVLDYPVWLNTVTDTCNYVYTKYNPRLSISIDDSRYSSLNLDKILFTSHSNLSLIAYNFNKTTDNQLYFDESFEIPMYYIIEYLARRKSTKTIESLFFMNQYLTVPEEYGVFQTVKTNDQNVAQTLLKKEDELFKKMQINYLPDNDIDSLLEILYKKLNSKLLN